MAGPPTQERDPFREHRGPRTPAQPAKQETRLPGRARVLQGRRCPPGAGGLGHASSRVSRLTSPTEAAPEQGTEPRPPAPPNPRGSPASGCSVLNTSGQARKTVIVEGRAQMDRQRHLGSNPLPKGSPAAQAALRVEGRPRADGGTGPWCLEGKPFPSP